MLWYNITMKSTLSTTLDNATIKVLTKDLAKYAISFNHPYMTHAFKIEDTLIQVYTSNKVVFQGELAQMIKDKYVPRVDLIPHAGSDEVGTGDYFGPVVVCACVCDEQALTTLATHNIMDSKLMDDETMISLYETFKDQIPHAMMIVSPTKYNEIHQEHNMNAIKAKLHYEAYRSLSKKSTLPSLCVIDQFTPKDMFYKYLNIHPEPSLPLHFETKAESKYMAVALASIFARAVFVLTLRKLESHYESSLPKGAGTLVDDAAIRFIEKHGEDTLRHVAKLHFKNTSRVLGSR
jgi:ribonuclease HIII